MEPVIRLATAADASAIADIYRPYVEDSLISFEEVAPDAAEMARRINGNEPGLYPWLVAEDGQRLLGYATSSPFRARRGYRWSVETGIYLIPEAMGRGFGRALLQGLIESLVDRGFVAAIGTIALPNAASVRLHEALGFVHTGTQRKVGFKFGEWIDIGLWQRDLAPRSASPPEPGVPA
jgi:phosphinothricin acetyltransferase